MQKYGDREDVDKFDHEFLARHILDVPLGDIRCSAKAPDWLGYLGLALVHCYAGREQISHSWATQFLEMLPRKSIAYGVVMDISGGVKSFRIDDLELIEEGLYGRIS